MPADPATMLRSRSYLASLMLAAILGVPVSAAAYGFLALVNYLPALFIGAAGGIALSHLPGLPMVAGVAMGIGAMSVVMLSLPLTSVLLPAALLPSDAFTVMPLVVVAVVVAYVVAARITPKEGTSTTHVPAQPVAT